LEVTVPIFTKTGDNGRTSLLSGERVDKADCRLEAYGSVDELNSILGALIAALSQNHTALINELHVIQTDLFDLSAWLAATPGSQVLERLRTFSDDRVVYLEEHIDPMWAQLPRLNRFIQPGGHAAAAWAHVARAVARRVERQTVRLMATGEYAALSAVDHTILRYLNRLSDYLFVLARFCNFIHDIDDIKLGEASA